MTTVNDTLRAAVHKAGGISRALYLLAEMCHVKADETNDTPRWTKMAEALEGLGRDTPLEV